MHNSLLKRQKESYRIQSAAFPKSFSVDFLSYSLDDRLRMIKKTWPRSNRKQAYVDQIRSQLLIFPFQQSTVFLSIL